jgi:hypothetical protein
VWTKICDHRFKPNEQEQKDLKLDCANKAFNYLKRVIDTSPEFEKLHFDFFNYFMKKVIQKRFPENPLKFCEKKGYLKYRCGKNYFATGFEHYITTCV